MQINRLLCDFLPITATRTASTVVPLISKNRRSDNNKVTNTISTLLSHNTPSLELGMSDYELF